MKKPSDKKSAPSGHGTAPAVRFGPVIKEARKTLGITQADLAQRLGISRFTVRNWESDINKPDHDTIPKLCAVLELSVQDLFGIRQDYSQSEKQLLNNFRRLRPVSRRMANRIISSMLDEELEAHDALLKSTTRIIELLPGAAAAGTGYEFLNLPAAPFFLRTNDRNSKADAVVRVSGKSMEPVYHDGDYLYLSYSSAALPGEDVVAGWHEGAIVKRLGDDGTLYSINPDYPFEYDGSDGGVRLIGRVLGIVTSADMPDPGDEDILRELFSDELRAFHAEHGLEP